MHSEETKKIHKMNRRRGSKQQHKKNKSKNKRVIFLFFTNKINLLIIFKEISPLWPFISKQSGNKKKRSLSKTKLKRK